MIKKNLTSSILIIFFIMSVIFLVNCQKGKEVEEKTEGITTVRVGYLPSLGASQLYVAIAKGYFANIKRKIDGGKGLGGVFKKAKNYYNPVEDHLKQKLKI